jgi:pimeloyl-ACP methyl ester carboxylesterase
VITWLNTSFEMRFRVIDGLTVRYAQSENRGDHALLLSPWPESLLAFEPVWSRLDTHAHLVAIDLPGFGHSQRHDALLSPRAMAEFVIRAADAFALDQPHLVGPGTGTAAALFAAAVYPDRLRSLVVGSGAAAVPLALGGLLKDWVEAEDADEFCHADPQQLLISALAGIERYVLPEPVRQDYLLGCQGNRFAASLRYVRSYPAELPVLAGLLPRIHTPVQIIAGGRDSATPPVNAEFLHQRLPRSTLDLIDAGHFVWEDAAADYAALITRWWAGGYKSTTRTPAGSPASDVASKE